MASTQSQAPSPIAIIKQESGLRESSLNSVQEMKGFRAQRFSRPDDFIPVRVPQESGRTRNQLYSTSTPKTV